MQNYYHEHGILPDLREPLFLAMAVFSALPLSNIVLSSINNYVPQLKRETNGVESNGSNCHFFRKHLLTKRRKVLTKLEAKVSCRLDQMLCCMLTCFMHCKFQFKPILQVEHPIPFQSQLRRLCGGLSLALFRKAQRLPCAKLSNDTEGHDEEVNKASLCNAWGDLCVMLTLCRELWPTNSFWVHERFYVAFFVILDLSLWTRPQADLSIWLRLIWWPSPITM